MTKTTAPKKPKKPGRWKRRTIWTLGILIVLGIVARITIPLALPAVLRKVAGNFGMTCVYDRFELNLFSGDAGIWGLEFKPQEGGEAIFAADYCHGNVSVLNLLRGRLNVWRIEADGVDVNVDRNADGHIPLLDRFIAATSKSPAPATPVATKGKPADLDLSSPLRVDALRLDHIRVHIHDRGVSPEVDTELAMDLRLSDLGSPITRTKFEMNLSADPLLDTLRITGEGQSAGKTLDAKLNVLVRGIRPKPAAAYLAALGLRPASDGITLTAQGHVHTAPAPNNAEGFTASVDFNHLAAVVDRDEAMALDHLTIDTGVIDTKSIRIDRCVFEGARAVAGRAENGNIQIVGLEYDPALASHPTPTTQKSEPSSASPQMPSLLAERWSVGELSLKNARVDFHDRAVTPVVHLSFVADELSASSIDHDPKNKNTTVTLTGRMHSHGMIRDIKLDGTATPFADDKKFDVTVNATGIKPDAIKPYLDQIGLDSTLKDAQFTAAATATLTMADTITAGVKVSKFDFRDELPLLALTDVTVSKATLDPATAAITIGDVELTGPGISVLRDSSGEWNALGLRTKKPVMTESPKTAPVATTGQATQPFTTASLPKITLAKFGWTGINIELEDQTTTPATKVSIPDIGITASDVTTVADAQSQGTFKAWLNSPQLVKKFEAVGSLTPQRDGIKAYAKLDGSGLNAMPLAPYLKPFGVEPVLQDGGVTGWGTLVFSAGPSASISLQEIKYTDGSITLAAIDSVRVDGAALDKDGITVQNIQIVKPHISARRDADGSLAAGGFRIVTQPTPVADATITTVAHAPLDSATTLPVAKPAAPLVVLLPKISVENAGIDWTDLAARPDVTTSATASVRIDHLTLGKDAVPATLNIKAAVNGCVDDATVTGLVTAGPSWQAASIDVSATGVRAGPLAAYLPPGIGSSLKDGKFAAHLEATLLANPAGGFAGEMKLGPLDFADDTPLLHLDSVHVKAPHIELPDTALAVDEISVKGLSTHAEKLPGGEIACMGLLIGKEEKSSMPVAVATAGKPGSSENLKDIREQHHRSPTTGPSVEEIIAASHRVLPAVTVDTLDLNVSNFTFRDLSRPESSPLVVSDLRFHNLDRIDWLGKDAFGKPPTKLQFGCKISPLVDQVLVDISVAPFARQPHLSVQFAATGIHGDGLTQLIPELKKQVDGTAMNDGSLTAHFGAEAKWDRKNPIDFDLSHGFDLDFVLDKVRYRDKPNGPVLAGVDEVRSEAVRIDPADSMLHFKTLEITKPIGLITQDSAGIHALGWVYKLPTAEVSSTQPVTQNVKPDADKPGSSEYLRDRRPDVVEAKPTGEIRIDKLLISDLDFQVLDSAVTPPLMIPLNGLDVEVRNLSSLAPYQDSPIRFSAIVNAGKVNLPKRGSNPPVMEQRDLFTQITANGEISLYPNLHGWAKTSVSGLDLAALQGAAAQFNETLTGGLYDSDVNLRFDPDGAVTVNSRFTLTDLSLSEPSNGFISGFLHMPLGVAIGAVEGEDKSIALPINLSVDPKHVSYPEVGAAAAGAVVSVISTAIAAAPLKAADDFGNLIGLGGNSGPQDLTTTVPFSPGSAAFGAEQSAALAKLLKEMHDDASLNVTLKHQLGMADVEVARTRANPTLEQSDALESQLRSRKAELLHLRADAAGKARADLASLGETAAAPSLDRLRAIDREVAATDESLDQVGELLKPSAGKLAERRTRTAALRIAAERMYAIKSAIVASGISADRVKLPVAQFNPADDLTGGKVVILVVKKK